jgi:hypothetical protein
LLCFGRKSLKQLRRLHSELHLLLHILRILHILLRQLLPL